MGTWTLWVRKFLGEFGGFESASTLVDSNGRGRADDLNLPREPNMA